jgi:hypothetical protein
MVMEEADGLRSQISIFLTDQKARNFGAKLFRRLTAYPGARSPRVADVDLLAQTRQNANAAARGGCDSSEKSYRESDKKLAFVGLLARITLTYQEYSVRLTVISLEPFHGG